MGKEEKSKMKKGGTKDPLVANPSQTLMNKKPNRSVFSDRQFLIHYSAMVPSNAIKLSRHLSILLKNVCSLNRGYSKKNLSLQLSQLNGAFRYTNNDSCTTQINSPKIWDF